MSIVEIAPTCPQCDDSASSCSTCGGYSGWPNPPNNITLGPCKKCVEGIAAAAINGQAAALANPAAVRAARIMTHGFSVDDAVESLRNSPPTDLAYERAQFDAAMQARDPAPGTIAIGDDDSLILVNDGTTALQGAKVRLSQGAESYVGATNASGQVVFAVDAATWSVAITKPGYAFTPTTLVVAASGSTTYSMTASGPTPSSDPDKTTVRITCYGADTEVEASATVQLRQLTTPSGDEGNAFDGAWETYTADAEGIVDVTLWSDATYAIRRGATGDPKQFTPTGATDSFTSILSR